MHLRLPSGWYWFACGFTTGSVCFLLTMGRYWFAALMGMFTLINAFMGWIAPALETMKSTQSDPDF